MILNKKDRTDILENAITWVVVFAMFVYGGAKVLQFQNTHLTNKLVSNMTGMELMWSFYGYSKAFVWTLSILEIAGGILLLVKKTRLLGCLWTTAILVNIILQDIFYSVNIGALAAAVLYQLLILGVLWINREKVMVSVKALLLDRLPVSNKKYFTRLILSMILFLLFRIGEYFITIIIL